MGKSYPYFRVLELVGGAPRGLDIAQLSHLIPDRHPSRLRFGLTLLWRFGIIKRTRFQVRDTGRPRHRFRLNQAGQDLMELWFKADERRYALRGHQIKVLAAAAKLARRNGLFSVRKRPPTPGWLLNSRIGG